MSIIEYRIRYFAQTRFRNSNNMPNFGYLPVLSLKMRLFCYILEARLNIVYNIQNQEKE